MVKHPQITIPDYSISQINKLKSKNLKLKKVIISCRCFCTMEFFPNMRIFSIQRIDIFIFSFLHSLTMLSYLNNNIFSRSEQTTTAFTVSDLLRENPQVGKINPRPSTQVRVKSRSFKNGFSFCSLISSDAKNHLTF